MDQERVFYIFLYDELRAFYWLLRSLVNLFLIWRLFPHTVLLNELFAFFDRVYYMDALSPVQAYRFQNPKVFATLDEPRFSILGL